MRPVQTVRLNVCNWMKWWPCIPVFQEIKSNFSSHLRKWIDVTRFELELLSLALISNGAHQSNDEWDYIHFEQLPVENYDIKSIFNHKIGNILRRKITLNTKGKKMYQEFTAWHLREKINCSEKKRTKQTECSEQLKIRSGYMLSGMIIVFS